MGDSSGNVTISLRKESIVTKRDLLLLFTILLLLVSVSLLFTTLTPRPIAATISYVDRSSGFWRSDVFSVYSYMYSIIKTDLGTITVTDKDTIYALTMSYADMNLYLISPCLISLLISLSLSFSQLVSRNSDDDLDYFKIKTILVFNLLNLPFSLIYCIVIIIKGICWKPPELSMECKPGSMWVIFGFAFVFMIISTILVIILFIDSRRWRKERGLSVNCSSCCGSRDSLTLNSSEFSSLVLLQKPPSRVVSTEEVAVPLSFIERLLFREDFRSAVLFVLRLVIVILAFSAVGTNAYSAFFQQPSNEDDPNAYTNVQKYYSFHSLSYVKACIDTNCYKSYDDSLLPGLGKEPFGKRATFDAILIFFPLLSLFLTILTIAWRLRCFKLSQRASKLLHGVSTLFDLLVHIVAYVVFFSVLEPFEDTVKSPYVWNGPKGAVWGGQMGPGLALLLAILALSQFCIVYGIGLSIHSFETTGSRNSQTPLLSAPQNIPKDPLQHRLLL